MLDCGETLDIAHVQQWRESVSEQLENISEDIDVNVSALQKIDTAGVQLLAAIVKKVDAAGKKVIWSEFSPAFINAVTILGLQNVMGMTPR